MMVPVGVMCLMAAIAGAVIGSGGLYAWWLRERRLRYNRLICLHCKETRDIKRSLGFSRAIDKAIEFVTEHKYCGLSRKEPTP